MVMFVATIALTGYLYVIIPKGFFPQQDTGLILGITEAAQDISFAAMARRQRAPRRDRRCRTRPSPLSAISVGAGGSAARSTTAASSSR